MSRLFEKSDHLIGHADTQALGCKKLFSLITRNHFKIKIIRVTARVRSKHRKFGVCALSNTHVERMYFKNRVDKHTHTPGTNTTTIFPPCRGSYLRLEFLHLLGRRIFHLAKS